MAHHGPIVVQKSPRCDPRALFYNCRISVFPSFIRAGFFRLTRRLEKQGIAVDTLVLMETAAQDSVPANVASCLNVYKSSSVADEWVPAFRGLPVTVESAQTHLVNYNLRFHDEAVAESLYQLERLEAELAATEELAEPLQSDKNVLGIEVAVLLVHVVRPQPHQLAGNGHRRAAAEL